jgi:hypothetical protein
LHGGTLRALQIGGWGVGFSESGQDQPSHLSQLPG